MLNRFIRVIKCWQAARRAQLSIVFTALGLGLLNNGTIFSSLVIAQDAVSSPLMEGCPQSVEERSTRHTVKSGETLNSIAQQYQLSPATIQSMNPRGGRPGRTLLIPPFNGQYITAPTGATWKDLANAYGVRADLLFEINGCDAVPRRAFIPGANWQARGNPQADNYTGLSQYPVSPTVIGLDYGWHNAPNTEDAFFHSGIDLLAPLETPVRAAADGRVILVSQEGSYGFLVVIDHGNNRQTRYAHLSRFAVSPEETVTAGSVIGYVGTTGRPDITEPHVHFEVRFRSPAGWVAQDPKLHFPR